MLPTLLAFARLLDLLLSLLFPTLLTFSAVLLLFLTSLLGTLWLLGLLFVPAAFAFSAASFAFLLPLLAPGLVLLLALLALGLVLLSPLFSPTASALSIR